MTLTEVKAMVGRHTPSLRDPAIGEVDACPACGHGPRLRLRRGCSERLQVVYDSDEVRCGCLNDFHRR
ncbi:hypothetical protein GCM10009798_01390 [Nocardioides panacihumi]|uniref:Uncharacterized protein n=1 Tax=Nocardioides panacihumi TaxID=400774 RepID=A0ABN2Q793_9ACTN